MRFLAILSFASLLPACALVDGDRILGKNLAQENPAFATIDPAADLGPAPVAGARRTLLFFELERLSTKYSVALGPADSREACFERTTVHLNSDTLQATLRLALHVPDLEVLDFSQNALPLGRPEFRLGNLGVTGLWPGRWLYGENRSVPIWARVHSPSGLVPFKAPSTTREIGRGETVRVEVQSGGVLLAFDAAAESSGHRGEQVTVRNPANGQLFRAVVQGPGR